MTLEAPAHSDCGPSSLKRRIDCPGSRNAERGLPDRTSKDAAEGSVFHEVAALCLEFGMEPEDFLGRELESDGYTFEFDETFARHMRPGLDRVRELLADCEHFGFETRVDISPWTEPGQFGTTDVWGISVKNQTIKIHDWKYGEGVGVEAEDNWQAIAYALGIWNDIGQDIFYPEKAAASGAPFDPAGITVEIIIDQMRRPDSGGKWVTNLHYILERGKVIREAIRYSNDPDAPRIPGFDQCFFCKAKGRCAALAAFNLEQAGMKFDDLDEAPPSVRDLTPDEMAKVIRNGPLWTKWLNSVHQVAFELTMQGQKLPGIKAVPGRAGHRIWLDEAKAEAALVKVLGDDAFTRKLVSPAQAEKKLGADDRQDLAVLWTQRETKPSLVADDDDREAIEPHSAKFDNLELEDG